MMRQRMLRVDFEISEGRQMTDHEQIELGLYRALKGSFIKGYDVELAERLAVGVLAEVQTFRGRPESVREVRIPEDATAEFLLASAAVANMCPDIQFETEFYWTGGSAPILKLSRMT